MTSWGASVPSKCRTSAAAADATAVPIDVPVMAAGYTVVVPIIFVLGTANAGAARTGCAPGRVFGIGLSKAVSPPTEYTRGRTTPVQAGACVFSKPPG